LYQTINDGMKPLQLGQVGFLWFVLKTHKTASLDTIRLHQL